MSNEVLHTWNREPLTVEESPEWQKARAVYFARIALRHRDAWQMHHDNGQFSEIPFHDGAEGGVIAARPAVKHCLVEAARARVLGRMLGLSEAAVGDLEKAALLHDSFKGQEVKIMKENGPNWQSYDYAQARARLSWEQTGRFSQTVMDVAGSVAHESLHDMEAILALPGEMTEREKMQLAMHYLDDFTVEFDWARPAGEDGNDLDRRMVKNENNERYMSLNQEGRMHFNGETAYQAQRRVGHLVEDRLATLIWTANDLPEGAFNPLDLPVIIDNQIKQEITQLAAATPVLQRV
jgi:hypothetical protein